MNQQQHVEPTIGYWYDAKNYSETFRVVAFDTEHDAVEIQYFDGEIEEMDFDTWHAINPHEIAEPEEAMAPYEMEREDILDLLNQIETEEDLETHIRHLDEDESSWH